METPPGQVEASERGRESSRSGCGSVMLTVFILSIPIFWLRWGMEYCVELQAAKKSILVVLPAVLLNVLTPILLLVGGLLISTLSDVWDPVMKLLKALLLWTVAGVLCLTLLVTILPNLVLIANAVFAVFVLFSLIGCFISFLSKLRITGIYISGVHLDVDDDDD